MNYRYGNLVMFSVPNCLANASSSVFVPRGDEIRFTDVSLNCLAYTISSKPHFLIFLYFHHEVSNYLLFTKVDFLFFA